MFRRIDFIEPTYFHSRGRNGTMQGSGVEVALMGETADRQAGEACIRPITSRGDVSDAARVVVPSEAIGEVAAAFAELYARFATPQARSELAARLAVICDTGMDPRHDEALGDEVVLGPLPAFGDR